MKIRTGFVSNSSSSSFIVASKNKPTKKMLMHILNVNKDSFLMYDFAKEVADFIVNNIEEADLDEVLNDYSDYDDTMGLKFYKKIKAKGFKLYRGMASDEGVDAVENYLCNTTFNFENDEIILVKEDIY